MKELLQFDGSSDITISPMMLTIPEFETIWKRDRTKGKRTANKEVSFIFFYTDFRSPLVKYSDKEREDEARKLVFGDDSTWRPDDKIWKAIKKYEELQETPTMAFLKDARKAVNKLRNYFDSVDFSKTDDNGKPIYDVKKFSDAIKNAEGIIETLKSLEEKVKEEQETGSKVQGGEEIGAFEDG